MTSYITGFIFYTLAMIGVLVIGYLVYKKTNVFSNMQTNGIIKIIDSLAISPKKVLMVVKIKNEKFLIASGAEHTTFLAKLDDNNPVQFEETIRKELKNEKVNIANKTQLKPNYSFDNEYMPTQGIIQTKKQIEEEFDNKVIKNKSIKNLADNILENQTKLQQIQKQFDALYNKEKVEEIKRQKFGKKSQFNALLTQEGKKANLKQEQYGNQANNLNSNYNNYLKKQAIIKELLN